ncbi:MAG: META domain-containing protein [Chloroflexi bacterium]|nr:MAG: META domain-containing protein [Chloroflexota bacterium]
MARAVALVVIAGLILVACSTDPVMRDVGGPGRPTTLAQTAWTVVSVAGRAPRVTPLTIAFDAGEIRGDSGCNSFDASYTYDPATGALAVDSLTSTERACGADRGDLEAALFDALRAASAASIDAERRLTLAGPGGTIVLVQRATFEPG